MKSSDNTYQHHSASGCNVAEQMMGWHLFCWAITWKENFSFVTLTEIEGDEMSKCDIARQCSLYKKDSDPQVLHSEFISKYCNGQYKDCARYKFVQAFGIHHVPRYLQPHDTEQVRGIIHSLVE